MKMINCKREAADRNDPLLPQYYGTFERTFECGGRKRRLLLYISEGARPSTAGILLVGPDGMTAEEILEEGSWRKLADTEETKEKLILGIVQAPDEGWNTSETYGLPGGHTAYIDQAALLLRDRTYCCVHESKLYLVGIREGGCMAQMAAVWNPAYYAGAASVGGPDVREAYLMEAGEDYCTALDGYEDPAHRKGIRKKDIPVPALIITDPSSDKGVQENILRYRIRSCGASEESFSSEYGWTEYRRTAQTPYAPNQDPGAYRVCSWTADGASEGVGASVCGKIWKDFLYRQRRWMSSPEGDLRVTEDPVRDLHMDYYYEMIDGFRREWYVYVPSSVRGGSAGKVPLVFALHGYSCSGEIYAGNSGWHKVADRHGFIVVYPTALPAHVDMPESGLVKEAALLPAWNVFREDDRPDELSFFRQLLARTKRDYPVDPARVFVTGHSWGSMMTQLIGMGMTEEITAIAPCSGVFFGGASKRITAHPEVVKRKEQKLPVWMFWGTEEEWLIPAVPARDNETGYTLDLWMERNGHKNEIPGDWSEAECAVNGRFRDYFHDGGTPVRYTIVDYMPHATMPEMSFRIWEEFFQKF